jgi:hypothetical protein
MNWYRLLPWYWFDKRDPLDRDNRICMEWDERLNDLIDSDDVEIISANRVTIGGAVVWIGNWPHSYGRPWAGSGLGSDALEVMPTIATRHRLRAAISNSFGRKPIQRTVNN